MNMKLNLRDIIYIGLSTAFLTMTCLLYIKVDRNHDLVNYNSEQMKVGMQRIESGIPWSVSRQKTIQFMQHVILSTLKDSAVDNDMAYRIAENNFILTAESFRTLDPLFLLAIQWQESKFIKSIVVGKRRSSEEAQGVCQLMVETAKDMADIKGLTWSNDYLTNPIKNTYLAVILLDRLQARGYSKEQILAYYNYGYRGPNAWIHNRKSLPEETKDFIPSIMNKYKEYQKNLKNFEVTKSDSVK